MNKSSNIQQIKHRINYYMVWKTKNNDPILTGEIAQMVETKLINIAQEKEWIISRILIEPTNVQIAVSVGPQTGPTDIAKILKGVTGRQLLKVLSVIQPTKGRGTVWEPQYYVATEGNINKQEVMTYIKGISE